MPAKIINGKAISDLIAYKISCMRFGTERPGIAIMSIGHDDANQVYIRNKVNMFRRIGFRCDVAHLPIETPTYEAIEQIERWNSDKNINGIILQLPAPSASEISGAIRYDKDVDGLLQNSKFTPCTPRGIMLLLEKTGLELSGKHAVVVGRSQVVGRPVAKLLLDHDCTVTMCHSKTENLSEHTRNADIIIAAAGVPKLITSDMVKHGAVVIDVGINHVDGKLVGDVDFDEVSKVAGWITPVPGGVGPMTVAMLAQNVCEAYKMQHGGIGLSLLERLRIPR